MQEIIPYATILIALLLATISDFKKREVPNFISFFTIFIAISTQTMRIIQSPSLGKILSPLIGFVFAFAVSLIFFYTKQWGGADAKLFIALGVFLGWPMKITTQSRFSILNFTLLLLLSGALYGLIAFTYIFIKHRKRISPIKKIKKEKKMFFIALATTLIIAVASLKEIVLLPFAVLPITIAFAVAISKDLEKLFTKKILPENLVEGDWIVSIHESNKNEKTPFKKIASKSTIKKLINLKKKGKIKYVEIKEGIPFIPPFLIAFFLLYFINAVDLIFLLRTF